MGFFDEVLAAQARLKSAQPVDDELLEAMQKAKRLGAKTRGKPTTGRTGKSVKVRFPPSMSKADIERELQKIRTTPAGQSGNIAVRALGYDPGRPWSRLTAEEQEKIVRHVADRGAERRVCAEPVRLVRK